ncbi:MAG: DNA primase small subunit domain-containing protein [Nanoarchaeota archaeon]
MDIGTILRHYKREDVQKEMVEHAQDREIAIKFGDKGFGKRPDILKYPRDVLELAKLGATSFHASEELWKNPLQLDPKLKKKEINDLRIGWDLVLDVDFEEWEATKIITNALVKALKDHGIKSISVKFSGNKGFHIAVPFQAFPNKVVVSGKIMETRELFPESVRRIAEYLSKYIDKGFKLSEKIFSNESFIEHLKNNNKTVMDFIITVCSKCESPIKLEADKKTVEFVCPECETRILDENNSEFIKCDKCSRFMERFDNNSKNKCKCGNGVFQNKFNLKIDTVLISSRHLFRSVYSLHEKSGLVSIPIDPNYVLQFDKKMACCENVSISKFKFLSRENVNNSEGKKLIVEAFDYNPEITEDAQKEEKNYEEIKDAVPEKFFPPCVYNILKGLADGKKRSLFILVNFLVSCGWGYDEIEKRLIDWNKANEEPLREVIISGHLRYHKAQKKKILPPNCANEMYYKDFRICTPDNLCARIKNPVNYAIIKTRYKKKKKEGTVNYPVLG